MSPAAPFTRAKSDHQVSTTVWLTAHRISSAVSKPGNDITSVFSEARNSEDAPVKLCEII